MIHSCMFVLSDTYLMFIGSETITYTNNSPDTLHYLWLQLDANLFTHDLSAEQLRALFAKYVRNITLDGGGNVTNVETFTTGANIVVHIIEGLDGHLYFVDLDDGLVGRWSVS